MLQGTELRTPMHTGNVIWHATISMLIMCQRCHPGACSLPENCERTVQLLCACGRRKQVCALHVTISRLTDAVKHKERICKHQQSTKETLPCDDACREHAVRSRPVDLLPSHPIAAQDRRQQRAGAHSGGGSTAAPSSRGVHACVDTIACSPNAG